MDTYRPAPRTAQNASRWLRERIPAALTAVVLLIGYLPAPGGAQQRPPVEAELNTDDVPYRGRVGSAFYGGLLGAVVGAGITYPLWSQSGPESAAAGALAITALGYPIGAAIGAWYAGSSRGREVPFLRVLATSVGSLAAGSLLAYAAGADADHGLPVAGAVIGVGHMALTGWSAR